MGSGSRPAVNPPLPGHTYCHKTSTPHPAHLRYHSPSCRAAEAAQDTCEKELPVVKGNLTKCTGTDLPAARQQANDMRAAQATCASNLTRCSSHLANTRKQLTDASREATAAKTAQEKCEKVDLAEARASRNKCLSIDLLNARVAADNCKLVELPTATQARTAAEAQLKARTDELSACNTSKQALLSPKACDALMAQESLLAMASCNSQTEEALAGAAADCDAQKADLLTAEACDELVKAALSLDACLAVAGVVAADSCALQKQYIQSQLDGRTAELEGKVEALEACVADKEACQADLQKFLERRRRRRLSLRRAG